MTLAPPLVCICIPNFNNESTIAETLDSLLNQSYKNIVIKIFDNASTDNSMNIIRNYEEKYSNVLVFDSSINIGAEGNFNKCIEHMEGVYSAIFHSDDIYLPTIIEEEVALLEQEKVSAVFCNASTIDSKGRTIGPLFIPKMLRKNKYFFKFSFSDLIKMNMRHGNILVCPSAMTRTDTYKKLITNWNGSSYKTAADIDVWLRLAEIGNIGLINKVLIKYRVSENSFSYRTLNKRVTPQDFFLVIDKYIERVDVRLFLSSDDYKNYSFLKFKDSIRIEKNSIFNGIVTRNKIYFTLSNFKLSFRCPKDILFLLAAFCFKIINIKNFSSKLIKSLKS